MSSASVWAPDETLDLIFSWIPSDITDNSKELVAADEGYYFPLLYAGTTNITVINADNTTWTEGTRIKLRNIGGTCILSGEDSAVLFNGYSHSIYLTGFNQEAELTYLGDNEWSVDVPVGVGNCPGYATSSTAITITRTDINNLIETTSDSAITISVPTEATSDLKGGFSVYGFHHGDDVITFSPTGITLIYDASFTGSVANGGAWTLIKSRVAANTWILYGKLVAA
jgi:hypothetical protein